MTDLTVLDDAEMDALMVDLHLAAEVLSTCGYSSLARRNDEAVRFLAALRAKVAELERYASTLASSREALLRERGITMRTHRENITRLERQRDDNLAEANSWKATARDKAASSRARKIERDEARADPSLVLVRREQLEAWADEWGSTADHVERYTGYVPTKDRAMIAEMRGILGQPTGGEG